MLRIFASVIRVSNVDRARMNHTTDDLNGAVRGVASMVSMVIPHLKELVLLAVTIVPVIS